MWPFRKKRVNRENIAPPKSKKGRPTREIAQERRLQKIKDAELEVKLLEIEQKKRRLQANTNDDEAIDLRKLEAINRQLKPFGLAIMSTRTSRYDDREVPFWERLADSELGAALGGGLAQLVTGAVSGVQSGQFVQQPQAQSQVVIPPQPSIRTEQPTVPQLTTPSFEQKPETPDETSPSFLVRRILSELEKGTPEQIAGWLLDNAKVMPGGKEIVLRIIQSEDNRLIQVLGEESSKLPDQIKPVMVPVLSWLAERPEKLRAIAIALRRLVAQQAGAQQGQATSGSGNVMGL